MGKDPVKNMVHNYSTPFIWDTLSAAAIHIIALLPERFFSPWLPPG
jgi:hypothetical protein